MPQSVVDISRTTNSKPGRLSGAIGIILQGGEMSCE
jgi:hypothetical protein